MHLKHIEAKIAVLLLCFPLTSFSTTRIYLQLDANVEFDLSLMIYPPLIFPTYYYPTSASNLNPQGINLIIQYQRIGNQHSVSSIYLSTKGSGNFSSSIGLEQLFFAPDGEQPAQPGDEHPGGNWRPFNIIFQNIEEFPVSGPGLRTFYRPQDYIFKAEPDDEAGTATITLYYRLYGL